MVDTGVVLGPASGSQYSFGAASNGNGWRVMWTDDSDYSVRTTGIGPDGSLLDPSGSIVGHLQHSWGGPSRSIAATGSGFITVWTADYDRTIQAARTDSAGAPIDQFVVFDSDSGQTDPAVAFDGDSTCLVVWTENPNGNSDIYAIRVTTGGRVLDPVPIQVAAERSQYEMLPTVAFGQDVYLVGWTTADTSFAVFRAKAARVTADGAVLDTAVFLRHDPAGAFQVLPALSFGDTCFLASWAEGTMEGTDIYAARVSVSGGLIDSAGIQLCSGPTIDAYASVCFDGTGYLVMWCEMDTMWYFSSLRGRRMTADGVPLDSGLIRPELPGYSCMYPSVATDGSNFLVSFSAEDTYSYDVNVGCVRISPEGILLDSGIFFPLGADAQSGPSGSSDGTDFLAAWFEAREQGVAVQAARISADGTVLDPVGFPVNDAPRDKFGLGTAFGDSMYLVAWVDYRGMDSADVHCARVTRDGQVLDPDGIVVCDEASFQYVSDVSFDGQNFLLVWEDYRSQMHYDIYAARVSPTGVVLDPGGFPVAAADTFDDYAPAVCFTGAGHLVVWQGTDRSSWESNIYGALVSPAGTITKPRFVISGATGNQMTPSAARGLAHSLVAWQDTRFYPAGVYAARVRDDGTVLDPNGIRVDSADYDDESPRVTATEAGFKVLWRRYDYMVDTTVFAVAQVDTSGSVVRVGDWFGLPGYDNQFDAVYGSGPEMLLLFSCWTDSALGRYFGTDRLWGRLGSVPGIQSPDNGRLRNVASGATIVRGVLHLAGSSPAQLVDISGRKVMDLPGALTSGASGAVRHYDLGRLSPGIYFVREELQASSPKRQAVRKVVLTR